MLLYIGFHPGLDHIFGICTSLSLSHVSVTLFFPFSYYPIQSPFRLFYFFLSVVYVSMNSPDERGVQVMDNASL